MSEERGSLGTSLLIFLAGAALGRCHCRPHDPQDRPGAAWGTSRGSAGRVKDRLSKFALRRREG